MVSKIKKQIIFKEEIEEVKKHLPKRGSFGPISKMTGGRYKTNTIRHMFAHRRTMSPVVFKAAKKLADLINSEQNNQSNNSSHA